MIRISNIAGAVVVDVAHIDDRVFGKEDQFGVIENSLPIQIPARNIDERSCGAIGKRGGGGQFPSQTVGVGIDGEEINIDRHGERVSDDKIGIAGRNVESQIILKFKEDGEFRGWLIGEIDADAR